MHVDRNETVNSVKWLPMAMNKEENLTILSSSLLNLTSPSTKAEYKIRINYLL